MSGYHMALVAGVVFFVLRACPALIPGLASARPIKKWSAIGALIAAFGYLLLSGSEAATQRSFIMTAVVLIGVMADRPALTLRTLAIAAFALLLLADGKLVSQVIMPDAFEEDCRLAAVVVTSRELPGECKAIVIDRKLSRANGAIALRWNGDGFAINASGPAGQDRPWAHGSSMLDQTVAPAVRTQLRDATPRADDLEAGD